MAYNHWEETSSEASTLSYEHEKIHPDAPTKFTAVVGMDVDRAKAIIEPWGYYCVCKDYTEYKRALRKDKDSATDAYKDDKRVILFLDKHGYVAVTPTVG